MSRPLKKLLRVTYKTDADRDNDPDYQGSFSDPFPMNPGWEIAGVDWFKRGEVTVTWLIPA